MRPSIRYFLTLAVTLVIATTHPASAQMRNAAPAHPAAAQSPEDTANTQHQLIKLLQLSPTLTSVVARDPSLLTDRAYVNRNNPELAQFLARHPEVGRNPEFYLFSNLGGKGRDRDKALERAVWPDLVQQAPDPYPRAPAKSVALVAVAHELLPMVFIICPFLALVLIVRHVIESRRFGRFYKMQSDLHMRLIDKAGTNQELAAYLESDAGKGLFSSAPVALGKNGPGVPNVVGRVLTPLQIGLVLSLLGAGLMMLPRQGAGMTNIIFGVVLLMPGIGFILSAVAAWVIAKRLGLMPEPSAAANGGTHERL